MRMVLCPVNSQNTSPTSPPVTHSAKWTENANAEYFDVQKELPGYIRSATITETT